MKKNLVLVISKSYIGLCLLSLAYLSVFALIDPRGTMELVNTPLENNDAISSIRGVFGGVGTTICLSLLVLLRKKKYLEILKFLAVFWLLYAFSRLITLLSDGPLGAFGNQWIMIESFFGIFALLLYYFQSKAQLKNTLSIQQ
ncbi:MAG: DUF4345 domain-containing protein [Brumimicrobium sp.]|nr:DUF4345 domain-containing protein [Brumimicrobium sp.]